MSGAVEVWFDDQPCFLCKRDIPKGSRGQKVYDDDGNERLAHMFHPIEDYRPRCPKCRAVMPNIEDFNTTGYLWVDTMTGEDDEILCERCVEYREIAKKAPVDLELRMLDDGGQ